MTQWIAYPIARTLQAAQKRYRTARPGSVLILVVTLLVLMALIGTAYIATTRTDRYTSAQHVKNTQIDLLVEGVVNEATSVVNGDLNSKSPAAFRPPDDHSANTTQGERQPDGFEWNDSPGLYGPVEVPQQTGIVSRNDMPDDLWLSGRAPGTHQSGIGGQAYLSVGSLAGLIAVWDSPSYPLIQNGPTADQAWQFDTPTANVSPPPPGASTVPLPLGLPFRPTPQTPGSSFQSITFQAKPYMQPTTVTLTNPTTGEARTYPAMQTWEYASVAGQPPVLQPFGQPLIAADADGDGIADALLWKLPVGRIDGVTYYAAVRIVDNNSAVNVNTAWSNRENRMTGQVANWPHYFFPSSVGLEEMFRSFNPANLGLSANNTEMALLNNYRFNQTAPGAPQDSRGTRNDYIYGSLHEAMQMQLGSRVGNVGYVGVNTKMQGFSLDDSSALAYHNVLINPDALPPSKLENIFLQATAPAGIIDSIYRAAYNYDQNYLKHQTSFAANGQNMWYQGGPNPPGAPFLGNYNMEQETTALASPNQNSAPASFEPRRMLLTASSPVSNTAPIHYVTAPPTYGMLPANTNLPANTTKVNLPEYCIEAGMPNYSTQMETVTPPRTSINQAPFGELWRAFWNVMVENVTLPNAPANTPPYLGTPFDYWMTVQAGMGDQHMRKNQGAAAYDSARPDPFTINSPYQGQTFADYSEPQNTASYSPAPPAQAGYARYFNPLWPFTYTSGPYYDIHPARMFRNSIRAIPNPNVNQGNGDPALFAGYDVAAPRLSSVQMMLLRSAIAAVNAEDLRDSDDNVTAKRILLRPTLAQPGSAVAQQQWADVVVYGTERQPYITEVYADTDISYAPPLGARNPYGYVCIELYNPYDQDIKLTNWKLVALDRRSQGNPVASGVAPPYSNGTLTHTLAPAGQTAPFYNIPLDHSTIIADFDQRYDQLGGFNYDVLLPSTGQPMQAADSLIVPRKGYLLLENCLGAGAGPGNLAVNLAQHRPPNTGLPDGPILGNTAMGFTDGNQAFDAANTRPAAGLPQVNVACVPGLSGMVDAQNWSETEWATGIRSVLNRELVILRPRRADGNYSRGYYPVPLGAPAGTTNLAFNEDPNGNAARTDLRDLVPVDSYDFTGLKLPIDVNNLAPPVPAPLGKVQGGDTYDQNDSVASAWHYIRRNIDDNGNLYWGFIYPGRYDATVEPENNATFDPQGNNEPRPRQQGTEHRSWIPTAGAQAQNQNPWAGLVAGTGTGQGQGQGTGHSGYFQGTQATVPTFGGDPSGALTPVSNENRLSSYPASFNVPLAFGNGTPIYPLNGSPITAETNCIGANPILPQQGYQQKFPYGGFARDGDMLSVPFIGAYRITYLAPNGTDWTVAELNSVTADATFAEDTDVNDDPTPDNAVASGDLQALPQGGAGMREREQLGRFCPIRVTTPSSVQPGTPVTDYNNQGYPHINYAQPPNGGVVQNNQVVVNDFGYDPSYQPGAGNPGIPPVAGVNWAGFWRYRWASDLFSYLTAWSPADDFQPGFPTQRELTEGDSYDFGDLVSVFDTTNNTHLIYFCTAFANWNNGPLPAQFQMPPNNILWARNGSPAVQNGSAKASMRHANPIDAATEALGHTEDDVPIEGLININTAPWRVLATLPLVVDPNPNNPGAGTPDDIQSGITVPINNGAPANATYRQLNQEMAKAIVYWRDVNCNIDSASTSPLVPKPPMYPHGPFRSIYELNQVIDLRPGSVGQGAMPATLFPQGTRPGFQNGYWTLPLANTTSNGIYQANPPGQIDPINDQLGDFGPDDEMGLTTRANPLPDGVRGDYKEHYLQLTRISNLITTRSDSFTCYIQVQGWQDAETPQAKLVVQRRKAFIIDRSRVTAKSGGASPQYFYND